jgi:hypothetical protein
MSPSDLWVMGLQLSCTEEPTCLNQGYRSLKSLDRFRDLQVWEASLWDSLSTPASPRSPLGQVRVSTAENLQRSRRLSVIHPRCGF